MHAVCAALLADRQLLAHDAMPASSSRARAAACCARAAAGKVTMATYTAREVEQLISDARIPVERRVPYALKAIAGAAARRGRRAALAPLRSDARAARAPGDRHELRHRSYQDRGHAARVATLDGELLPLATAELKAANRWRK